MKKQQRKPQPEKRSRKSIILISLAVVLTVCCGLSALASLLGGGDTARTEPTPVVETALQLERQVQEVSASTDTPLVPTAKPVPATTPPTPTATPVPTTAPVAPTATPAPANTPTPVPATPTVAQPPASIPAGAVAAQLARVVDGDTIDVVIDGQPDTVRYIGIDTPEQGDPGYRAATDANAALLGAGTLYLVADASNRDRYDRLLRYVYTEDGAMVNREMIAQGWAQPVEYPPDTAFAREFREAASEAAAAGLGFWSGSASDGVMPYAVTTSGANIRSGPGTDFDISATATADTPLTVYGRTPDGEWLQVRTPDRSGGWISAGLVALAVAASQVEVAQDIPAPPVAVQAPTPTVASRSNPVLPIPPAAPQSTLEGIALVIIENHNYLEILQIDNRGAAGRGHQRVGAVRQQG